MSTPPQPRGRAAQGAYQRALNTYKESLSPKEYAKIVVPASLDDVVATAEKLQTRHKTSKIIRLIDSLQTTKVRLERFNTLLEGALSSVMGGQLLYASINFVFVVASDSADTFAKLLNVLVTIGDKMPQFEILANTFEESDLVMDSIEALYVAIIKFWVGAAKFYRKKRLWRLPLWNDYPIHFEDLVQELDNQERRLRDTAQVQHMQEARAERLENREFRRQGTFGRLTDAKVTKWLSPTDRYEPDFFDDDFRKANKKRHRGTCEWVLQKPLYKQWETSLGTEGAVLVLYGIPGAGKTILSSYLVQHCIHDIPQSSPRLGLYFFFDNKDEHKRSPLCAARSLVYQLHFKLREQQRHQSIQQEIEARMQNNPQEKAMSYEKLFAILKTVIISENLDVVIVLDAMDECIGPKPFIRDLKSLAAGTYVHLIVTSRSDNNVVPVFAEGRSSPTLTVTADDVKRDIVSYVQAKVAKSAALRHPQVKDRVITALATQSGGMFLWVYLMLKDLKSLPTVSEVVQALSRLPEKLDDVYKKILQRLHDSLKPGPRAFCQMVLKWIVSTSRPLQFTELVEALKAEYKRTATVFDQEAGFEDTLLYGKKDIELVCGSLVAISEDSIRLIHLSTRDYLRSSPESLDLPGPLAKFLVDVPLTQTRIAQTCLDYLSTRALRTCSAFKPSTGVSTQQRQQEIATISGQFSLFEYAVLYWPSYLIDNSRLQPAETMGSLSTFLQSDYSATWLEVYLLFSGPEYTASTVQRLARMEHASDSINGWADKLLMILDEFAMTLAKAPQVIHNFGLVTDCKPKKAAAIHLSQSVKSIYTVPSDSDTAKRRLTDVEKGAKSWVHFNPSSSMIFTTPHEHASMRLASQSSGPDATRYRPAIDAEEESPSGQWAVRSVAVRPTGSHIAVTFCPGGGKGVKQEAFYRTVLWLIRDVSKQTGADEWAERVLVTKVTNPVFRCPVAGAYRFEGKGNVVNFAANGILLTPSGYYDIFTEERLESPASIFEPGPHIANTSFGESNLARIRDQTELEVLSHTGLLQKTISFSDSSTLGINVLSRTGRYIVVSYSDETASKDLGRLKCVHLQSSKIVTFPCNGAMKEINHPRFTNDESFVIGCLGSNTGHQGKAIASWSVNDGSMIYLFKDRDPQLSFCLNEVCGQIKVVSSTGHLVNRGLGQEWGADEESRFRTHRGIGMGEIGDRCSWHIIGGSVLCMLVLRESSETDPELSRVVWDLIDNSESRSTIKLHGCSAGGAIGSSVSMSWNGQAITTMRQILRVHDGTIQRVSELGRGQQGPVSTFFSPNAEYLLAIEEQSGGRLLTLYKMQDDTVESLDEPQFLEGYIMDINVVFHATAPLFAVSSTSMDSYSGVVTAETRVVEISDGNWTWHHISRSFLTNFGFSYCGNFLYGESSMEEPPDEDLKDETHTGLDDGYADRQSLDPHEPDFDGVDHDHSSSSGEGSLALSHESPTISDRDTYNPHESHLAKGNEPGQDDGMPTKGVWPRLFPLAPTLKVAVPDSATGTIQLKYGSFYVCSPHMCRLRILENTGILYLDRMSLGGTKSKNTPQSPTESRMLCVVPDTLLKLSTTDIILVWPRVRDLEDTDADATVKIVVIPSEAANIPVVIRTNLDGPTLFDS